MIGHYSQFEVARMENSDGLIMDAVTPSLDYYRKESEAKADTTYEVWMERRSQHLSECCAMAAMHARFWNDPPSFCMVHRGGVVIMLAQLEKPGLKRPNHVVDPEGDPIDAIRNAVQACPTSAITLVTENEGA